MDYPNEKYRSSLAELTEQIRQGPRLPRPPISFQSISHLLLTVALLAAGVGGYFAYKHHGERVKAQELAARRKEFESRISRLTTRYNAATDWQRLLSVRGKPEKLYSAEVAPLLVRVDGRPILAVTSLLNVDDSNGRTVIYFDEATGLESQLKFRLDCTPDQAHLVMSAGPPQTFAVIAQIRSVEYALVGDYSLGTGECVDLMPISAFDYVDFVLGPEVEGLAHHAKE